MSTGGKRYEHVERVLHELYILGTRQATARYMLNTIKQRCFMLSDPCHVEKDNAACLFPAKCIRMFAPTSWRNPFARIAAFLLPFLARTNLFVSTLRRSPFRLRPFKKINCKTLARRIGDFLKEIRRLEIGEGSTQLILNFFFWRIIGRLLKENIGIKNICRNRETRLVKRKCIVFASWRNNRLTFLSKLEQASWVKKADSWEAI